MIRLAILGAGGLGKGMAQVANCRQDFHVVGLADSQATVFQKMALTQRVLKP